MSGVALIVIYVVFILGIIAFFQYSTKKRNTKYDEMFNRLAKGTKVLTKGGIIGTVVKIDESVIVIKSVNSELEFDKYALAQIIDDTEIKEEEEESEVKLDETSKETVEPKVEVE